MVAAAGAAAMGAFAVPALLRAAMRVAVVGAGVGGLAAAVRLAHAGHAVTVLERGYAAGGKCGRVRAGAFTWDSGPSLLTLPWVFRDLFADTGAPLEEELELLRVEPVTRYCVRRRQLRRAVGGPAGRARRARGVVARRGHGLDALPRHLRGHVARVAART